MAWAMRNLGGASLISSDGSVEQAYFLKKLNNNLEGYEGEFGITNGWFPPATTSCTGFNKATETVVWRMARCYYESGWSNPLYASVQHDAGLGNVCDGCDGARENDGISPWMEGYWVTVMGQLRDWGFKADYIHSAIAGRMMSMFADSTYFTLSPGPAGAMTYRTPSMATSMNLTRTGYLQTWAAVKAAIIMSTVLDLPMGAADTTAYMLDWGDTCCVGGTDIYDAAIKSFTYYKIDNEVIMMDAITAQSVAISAVNTSTSQVTAAAHRLTDGQQAMVVGGNSGHSSLDAGMLGNSLCRMIASGRNNFCGFWIHVVDANTVQFYNDPGLASLVTLTGGGSGMYLWTGKWTITRGALGTTATSHAQGATVQYWPVTVPPGRVGSPGAHAFFYTAAIATALDHDVSVTDAGTGKPITARRAWDIVNQITYNQQIAGKNVSNCAALGLNLFNCDDPRWGILPRPLIRNVRVIAATTAATLYYTAPDGNGCKIGVSTSPFESTNDAGDTSDGKVVMGRSYTVSSLTTGTLYYYRISCGPVDGSARIAGTFRTN
jgi:hypothetical protein